MTQLEEEYIKKLITIIMVKAKVSKIVIKKEDIEDLDKTVNFVDFKSVVLLQLADKK